MPTVLINGSPRENGNTMALANAVLSGIEGEKRCIHAHALRIVPCRACGCCAAGGVCVLDADDDMAAIRLALQNAERIVIASPLHFSSLTAPLIAAFSRLQPEWRVYHRARKHVETASPRGGAALAVTGGGRYANMFEAARIVASAVFFTLGLHFVGMVAATDTDALTVANNPAALARAAALGKKMTLWAPFKDEMGATSTKM